jgi:hypothetical protein
MKNGITISLLIVLLLLPFVVGSKAPSDPSPLIYATSGIVESESKGNVSGLTVFMEYSQLNTFDDTNGYFYKEFGATTATTNSDGKFVIRDTLSSYSYGSVAWEILRVRVISQGDTIKGETILRDSGKYISVPSRDVGCGSTSRTLPAQEVYSFTNQKVTIP